MGLGLAVAALLGVNMTFGLGTGMLVGHIRYGHVGRTYAEIVYKTQSHCSWHRYLRASRGPRLL